jgi:hypothetical protein
MKQSFMFYSSMEKRKKQGVELTGKGANADAISMAHCAGAKAFKKLSAD